MASSPLVLPLIKAFTQDSRRSRLVWFTVSLGLSIIYGVLVLQQAFSSDYVVQDDARQHVFWMQRYLDPELFPGDFIADYFQAAAPLGYAGLYQLAAAIGIEPLFLSKLLPPLFGVLTTGYTFWLSWEILPLPVSSFLTSACLSQTLWVSDELSSGTPRAFLYPLLVAFFYYLVRRAYGPSLVILLLQVLFYPQAALLCLSLVAVRLPSWQKGALRLSRRWRDYGLLLAGAGLLIGVVLYAKNLSEFGEIVTRQEALIMPEFQEGGRNEFFLPGLDFWLQGYPRRSGLLHRHTALPITLLGGLGLPMLLLWPGKKSRLVRQITPAIHLLWQLLLVSIGWFILAHLLLFELHLPSRYTSHTFRIVLAVAAGITWAIALHSLLFNGQSWYRQLHRQSRIRFVAAPVQLLPALVSALFLIAVLFYYPLLIGNFPKVGYKDFAPSHRLYEFLAAQPKDTLIASLSDEANNIPTFTGRSVWVAREYGLAYHKGYYDRFRQRSETLIEAQHTDNPAVLANFIYTSGIDLWLVDRAAFQADYLLNHRWRRQFAAASQTAATQLQRGEVPILQRALDRCTVFSGQPWVVAEARCIADFAGALTIPPSDPS